jgi:hypothetical protein
MSDTYKGVRLIGTGGLTLTSGSFSGFIATATETVKIAGARIYNASNSNLTGIDIPAQRGSLYPIRCQHIKPSSTAVIGLIE